MANQTEYKLTILPALNESSNESLLSEELYNSSIRAWLYWDINKWLVWTSHQQDMIALSKKYPDYLFILDGEGDAKFDIWRSFYKSGKSYTWKLEYNPPEFSNTIAKLMV